MPLHSWRRSIAWRLNRRRLAASLRHRGTTAAASLKGALVTSIKRGLNFAGDGKVSGHLRNLLWSMNQNYRSTGELPPELNAILLRLAGGEPARASELLPFLCLEGRRERANVNALLADACYQAQTPGHLMQAKVFIERAWVLSDSPANLLPLYLKIFTAAGDVTGIRAAYKRLGMLAASGGNISEAIQHFNSWQRAYYVFENLDRYEFDFDILASMDALAAPRRFHQTPRAKMPAEGEKIRLAYLVEGMVHLNSILIRISLEFAKFHDKTRFDVTFFASDTDDAIDSSPQGRDYIRMFESHGCRVVTVPNSGTPASVLLDVAGKIRDHNPHILITSAALARFEHYFIASLRPAPLVIGLVQGPPQQFAPPVLDWAIAWSKHPLMDTPVNCSLVEFKLEWSELEKVARYTKEQMNLPADACVLLSGGRPVKFQDEDFWRAIARVLAQHPTTYYLVSGVQSDEIPFLDPLLPEEVKRRVRFLGWRDDFVSILSAADIVIDTYPNGGGQVLVQAMSLGLPIVAHQNDYLKLFDQTNWSPVEDFIKDAELVVPRGDFERFERVVARLIEDEEYRARAGERCRQNLLQQNEKQGVRECEEIYLKVLELYSRAAPAAQAG
jgi:hypothetical protein